MPMLVQIVYMSAATRKFDAIELTTLLTNARQKNDLLDISGMLIYHDGSFLQVLEGEVKAVDALYERIARDERHTRCVMLLRTFIDRRSFGEWSMGFVNTKLCGPKSLPGFNDFFGKQFSPQSFAADPSTPHKLLLAFREGQWRQKVELGHGAMLVLQNRQTSVCP